MEKQNHLAEALNEFTDAIDGPMTLVLRQMRLAKEELQKFPGITAEDIERFQTKMVDRITQEIEDYL